MNSNTLIIPQGEIPLISSDPPYPPSLLVFSSSDIICKRNKHPIAAWIYIRALQINHHYHHIILLDLCSHHHLRIHCNILQRTSLENRSRQYIFSNKRDGRSCMCDVSTWGICLALNPQEQPSDSRGYRHGGLVVKASAS